jgi:4-amino-4-deoxy-L-arabinose transferase-like glycosyltransferase
MTARPREDSAPLRKRGGAERPDVAPPPVPRPDHWPGDVETVMLPPVKTKQHTNGRSPSDTADLGQPIAPDNPSASTRVFVLPLGKHGHAVSPFATPSARRTWVSRAVLAGILCLQAVLSLRMHNTAFEDEALYLYSGHMEIVHWLHGVSQQGNYAAVFSGAPVLYPVLGALADAVGGLAAARHVSLLAMLGSTALLYSMSRRLFNERVALCAAAMFSVTESAIFLGNFATYDAPAIFLLALAAWITVRTAPWRWPAYLFAAPVAALAVATKYAALLFVPTIAALTCLAALPYLGRRTLLRPAVFGIAVAGLLAAALQLAGHGYRQGISFTTTSRASGTTPTSTLLHMSLLWGGLPFAAALIGAVAYARRPRTEPNEIVAEPGGTLRRTVLGVVLVGTALLAPAEQIHLHTFVSLQKHIGFGLLFAAPMAGVGLVRIMGDHFRRVQLGIAVWAIALCLGMTQATQLYGDWPNSSQMVHDIALAAHPGAHYLVEAPEVPTYYLLGNPDAQPDQFTSTYYIGYADPQVGKFLTGDAGYVAALKAGYFQVVSYNYLTTPGVDQVLAKTLQTDPLYRLEAVIPNATDSVFTYVWVRTSTRKTAPATGRR